MPVKAEACGREVLKFDAWLVVEYNGKKGIVIISLGLDLGWRWNYWYQHGTLNIKGEMIHPITGKLVKVTNKNKEAIKKMWRETIRMYVYSIGSTAPGDIGKWWINT